MPNAKKVSANVLMVKLPPQLALPSMVTATNSHQAAPVSQSVATAAQRVPAAAAPAALSVRQSAACELTALRNRLASVQVSTGQDRKNSGNCEDNSSSTESTCQDSYNGNGTGESDSSTDAPTAATGYEEQPCAGGHSAKPVSLFRPLRKYRGKVDQNGRVCTLEAVAAALLALEGDQEMYQGLLFNLKLKVDAMRRQKHMPEVYSTFAGVADH
eukprot:GHRR01009586.1.p1 GENE.GHRR01009586.1~~GHRR01009586.1.p1  ORF type:complete len:214 (+),score=103.47 GHRR01009586.1:997-1638(+)